MEEKVQTLLTTIWDQSLNIEDEELIIKKLHKICFKDPLRNDQIIFICSRLIRSEVNLFKYLEANCGDKDRKSTSFRRRIIEFLKEFIVEYSQYCMEYLEFIKSVCSSIYISEQSLVVKEKVLSLIAKIIEHFDTALIEKIYKPKAYLEFLLDEIKLKRLGGTIKGGIWHIIGILVGKYSLMLNDYKIEIHDALFHEFKLLVNTTKKFESKAVTGILKSYLYLLEDPHLTSDQINQLYIFLKTMIKPLEDANSIKINKLSLEVISSHGKVFFKQIQKDSINLFDDIFSLCNHKNHELKMAANEAIEKISIHISDCLIEDNDIHKDAFKYLILKIKNVLETKSTSILINTAISLIGIFANAIVRFMGENILEKYLEELIVLFDHDILHALGKEAFKAKKIEEMSSTHHEGKEDLTKPSKSIKYVLAIQKQYISLLNSYSNIIGNLAHINELAVNHFYKILLIGFSTHQKFYASYREKLSDSIAYIIVNMFKHQNFFWSFLRKVIKNGFIESIKLTTNMLFRENIETNSIELSVAFWISLFNRTKIFTEYTLSKVFDQLMTEINELLSSLNLNYKEVNAKEAELEKSENENNNFNPYSTNFFPNDIYYEAENMNDLEICNRIISFLKDFLKNLSMNKLFSSWIIVLLKKLCLIASNYPRISSIYTGLSSIMRYCTKIDFFFNTNNNEHNNLNEETKSFLKEFESFNKNLIKKIEIFQDDLLMSSIEFLLSLPTLIMKILYSNDVESLKHIFKKAFEIGYNDIRYAKLALKSFKSWLDDETNDKKKNSNNIHNRGNKLFKEILPIFGDYLVEYEKIKESIDPANVELIDKYNKIQNKIFKILGEIGGEAHDIVGKTEPNSLAQSNTKILNILNSKNIEYPLPLYNKKYNIFFDHIIMKISDYAQNSFIKEKKYAAAELLHSLILYIIGLETKKSNVDNTNILVYLIEKVLNLACDLEKAISLIYETLLFQIVHWMAKKGSLSENKGIISVLDIIIENTSSRKNLKLRELSSDSISEYIKWFIKQHTDLTIKEKAATIKYIVRRIESNALHPDAFKRFGAVLCFEKIVSVIALNDSLVDKFILEIAFYCVSMLKISHNSSELSEIIFGHVVKTIELLIKIMRSSKKYQILSKSNPKRNFFKDIKELWNFLMEKLLVSENELRFVSQFLWNQIFDIIKTDLGFESLKQYFYVNKNYPQLNYENSDNDNNNNNNFDKLSVNYQFIKFMYENKILDLNDISIYYPRFSIENNIEDLKNTINILSLNIDKSTILSFILIVNLIYANKQSSIKILKTLLFAEEKGNDKFLFNLLITIEGVFNNKNSRKLNVKGFINDSYDNVYSCFIRANEKLFEILIEAESGVENLEEKIQNYLLEKVLIFKDFSDRNNVFESLIDSSLNEKANEFYFNLLEKIFQFHKNDINLNVFSKSKSIFLEQSKTNFKLLLSSNLPKYQNLIKNYFNFLFNRDFVYITELICENQYNFDFLADSFFNMINLNHKDHKIIEDFIKDCCNKESRIFLLFIFMEKLTISKSSSLVSLISKVFTSEGQLKNFSTCNINNIIQTNSPIDAIINQIKTANLIVYNYIEGNIIFNKKEIENISLIIEMYLEERSINIIKEIVNFLGLLVKLIGSTELNLIVKNDGILVNFLKHKKVDIKCYYQRIQSRFFPIKTKYLKSNTKEYNDFQLIYTSFLNTFKTVKSFEFLELLFPIIREEKTQYCKKVKNVLKEYIEEVLSNQNKNNLYVVNEIQKVIEIFLNKENDKNLRDNIRFTLMRILGFKLLSKCEIEILKEIFIRNYKTFEGIIKQNVMDISIGYENKFLMIQEKTVVFKFLEICFKRFPTEMLKNEIHKKLFGDNSQGNELTKILILELHNAKRLKIPDWDIIIKNIKNEEVDDLYSNRVENKFYCGAYCALATLIKSTQTKEDVYVKFLFQTFRDKNEKLFDLLINDKVEYNFTVETNFISKEINKGEKNRVYEKSSTTKKLLIDEIITDSFFHDAYGKTLKETLVMEQKTLNLEKPKELSKMLIENLEGFNKKYTEDNTKLKAATVIEQDLVNKQPIMETFLLILDHLHKNSIVNPSTSNAIMPLYLQHILAEMKREDCHLNLKIFFVKVIINKPEIFENYLIHFLPVLVKYSTDKLNGGKGFHYFIRDVATLLISNKNLNMEFNKQNIEMMSNYINALIKLSGDTKNIIFRTNLRIISELMDKFRNYIYLIKKTICDMMKIDDSKPAAHIWKISAVQIFASAMDYSIPIGDEELYKNNPNKRFINSLEKNEDIFPLLFKLCESHRTPVQSATIEFLAKIMFTETKDSKYFNIIYDHMENLALSKTEKYSINLVFRMSLHFKTLLQRKKIFNKSLSLFKNANQNNRNLLLHTYNNLIEILSENLIKSDIMIIDEEDFKKLSNRNLIDDIYFNIYELIDIIFVDPNDQLIINLTEFILNLLKIKDEKFTEGIMRIITKIQKDIRRKDEYTRQVFYEFLIKVYERKFNEKEILNLVITNLEKEPQHEIKLILISFLNKPETMPVDPVDRLIFLLQNLTVENIEEKLIQTITKMMLILTGNSADYLLKIYEKSLAECEYRDLNVNTIGYYLNRSQPVAPSMTIRSSMDEAYETVVNITQKDISTHVGYLRSTQDLTGSLMNTNINANVSSSVHNNNVSVKIENKNMNITSSENAIKPSAHELALSQHSSLISSSQFYSTQNLTSAKAINTGLKLSNSPLDSFKEPLPPTQMKKKARGLGKFLSDNEMFYTPVDQSTDNKIRFVPDGSYKDNRKQKEEFKDVLIKKWLRRQTEVRRTQVKLMRQYRIGDLPDILICNREIIDPLILLCDFNLEISSELFLEVMNSIYLESISSNKQNKIHELVENLLRNFKISNYLIISCLHRFMLNMMNITAEYMPDLYLIKKTGLFTKNYHTSILLLEEFILNNSTKVVTVEEKVLSVNFKSRKMISNVDEEKEVGSTHSNSIINNQNDIIINYNNKTAWVNLLKFYSKIEMNDYEVGLLQNFAENRDMFVKNKSDFLSVLSGLLTKSKNYIEKNVDISRLLKHTFNIYDSTTSINNVHEFNKYDMSLFIDSDLQETIEEYSIKYCSDLGEWDNVSQYLHKNEKMLTDEELYKENPEKIESMLKSWIYTETSQKSLSEFLESTSHTNFFKKFIDDTFNHYMSLFAIIQKDYDRALLYHEKAKHNFYKNWLNLGVHSGNLRHDLIHTIQTIYEISEFLDFVRGTGSFNPNITLGTNMNINLTPEGSKNIITLFDKWLNRWPNYIYDDANCFEEIYSERKVFYEAFRAKFYNFEHIISNNPVLDTFFPRSHTRISTIMFKKDFLDLAENHTKQALKIRKDNSISNSFIILPVLKNKYKILQIESSMKDNIDQFHSTAEKYEKLIKVLNDQIKNVNLEMETKEKLNILRVKLYLNVTLHYLEDEMTRSNNISVSSSKYITWLNKGLAYFNEEVGSYNNKMNDQDFCINYMKLLRPIVNFSDKIIRKTIHNKIVFVSQEVKDVDFADQINQIYVENALKGLIMGDKKIVNTIPKILDLLSKNTNQSELLKTFTNLAPKVSSNFYLKWKNQLIAYINSGISKIITPIIRNILDKDPQALFFPFSVIEKYSDILMDFKQKSELFFEIQNFFSEFKGLNSFLEALDGLTHPEHRLKYWLDNLKEVVHNFVNAVDTTSTGEVTKFTINKINSILAVIHYDILELNKTYIGRKLGSYNIKFSKDFEKLLKINLKIENFKNLMKKRPTEIIKELQLLLDPIIKNSNKTLASQHVEGIERLSTFSEWLAQYECSEFNNNKTYIELPLKEEKGEKRVMISSFDQHVLILSSIRRPKRLTIYGNDEKSYMFLVKGGEDIRLDQRIMEVFKAYNEILSKDSNCTKKNLKLNNFSVFPMTLKLGMIEWVRDTTPMKTVIKFSMNKLFKSPEWDLKNCAPQIARLKWLHAVTGDKPITDQHYIMLHMTNSREIVTAFSQQENLMPKCALKKGLEHYLLSPEEILFTRINFIRNYSALCIACYILGIGDRHLENFLINTQNSEILAIDFGVSFGQGVIQIIPELVPFRLTNQIRNVVYPFGKKGVIRQTMIDTLSAFKNNKDYILDYCEVFVKEPLLDWIKLSKTKLSDANHSNTSMERPTGSIDYDISWVPMKKLSIIECKLTGVNPVHVMSEELSDAKHPNEKTIQIIKSILNGDHNSLRLKHKDEKFLEVEDQVDVLIDQASDKNLLARMWTGWSPYI